MAFLDWIKNRRPQTQIAGTKPKPETAKEMYTRQAAQEKTNPLDRIPADERAKLDAIKGTLERATQHQGRDVPTLAAPADAMGNREALRQNMAGQDKAAPALSPTTTQTGKRATEKGPSRKTPESTAQRPQTVPRPRPSWER